jgi:transcriptional regulator with XRE-family HTH domain
LPASHEQSPASRNPRIHPGEAIRNERQRRGMSLRELARRTGVTPSHLSKLERGLTNCSVDTLWMVSEELGIAAADLFAGEKHSEVEVRTPGCVSSPEAIPLPFRAFCSVVDPAARETITMAGVAVEKLTPQDDAAMEFIQVRHEVGAGDREAYHHAGHEYGLVLQGRFLVEVGFGNYELTPGWSIAFDSSNPHRIRNIGEEPAVAIWVVTGLNQT